MEQDEFKIGDAVEAQVTKIHNFGAVVRIGNNSRGLIHISQVSEDFVKNISDYLKIGDKVSARIKKISPDGKIDLTLKKRKKEVSVNTKKVTREFRFSPLEDKIDEFLKKSSEVKK